MRATRFIASLALGLMAVHSPVSAQAVAGGYTAGDLLSPCQEADNDARWGEAAEVECEQYIMGFVGALRQVGAKADMGICAPEQNTADEVRWAFMRWVHASYSKRKAMPASAALLDALKENFPCQ